MEKHNFGKFHKKLVKEGIIRATLCGVSVGFAALLICAAACWLAGFNGIWLDVLVFFLTAAGATALFYFLLFSPNAKKMAKRIDELGLEERMLTMIELEGDDSFMAQKQRADALSALAKLNAGAMKIALSVPVIAASITLGTFAAGTTTVHALSAADVIPSGIELIRGDDGGEDYSIVYKVEGGGVIYGVEFDAARKTGKAVVKNGEDAPVVVAVADTDWVFEGWSDKNPSPIRRDGGASVTVTAVFRRVDSAEIFGVNDNITDPPVEAAGSGGENQDYNEEPQPKPGEQEDEENKGDEDKDSDDKNGGQGKKPNNQIIDGQTYYGDLYGMAYDEVMRYLESDTVPDYVKKIIKDYYDTIAE